MQTIFVDGTDYATGKEMHLALKRMLNLPAYYGCNADALYDCLSERREVVNLRVFSWGNENVAAALHKCAGVFEDLDGDVKVLGE